MAGWVTASFAVATLGMGGGRPALASGGGGHGEPAPAAPQEVVDATKSGSNGIDLGQFRIRAYYPAESQKSAVAFALYAKVEKDQLAELRHLLEHRKHKMRDQVIVATRLVPLVEFNDPELKSFRRRILLQLRRTLPELPIENVYISDFELLVERL